MQLLQKHIHLIPIDEDTTLFFHPETVQIYPFKNDNEVLLFLKHLKEKGEDNTKQQYGDDYSQYYDFIVDTISKVKSPYQQVKIDDCKAITVVNMPIAGHCNLACPYCFERTDGGFKFKDYTKEDVEKLINFLVKNDPNKDEDKRFTIVFFGGEPFLKFDIMKYTIDYCKEHFPNIVFRFSITTNGTIINDEIIEFLKNNNIPLLISIDGPDNEFNLRTYKNGNKSIGHVVENIKKLKDTGIDIELRATVVNNNPYIVETFQFFEDLQVPFTVMFAQTSENTNHSLANYDEGILTSIKQQFNTLEKIYIDKIKQKKKIYNRVLWLYSNDIRFRKKRNISCASGYNFLCITSDGDIFSCVHFINNKSHQIGTIDSGMNEEKRKQYVPASIETIEECQDCWIKYLCVGGCTAEKITSGRRNDQSLGENECELQRIVWEFYLKLYYYIMTYAPGYLIKEEKKETKDVIC